MADDLMRMQRQAAQRVRQMQDHSRRVFEAYQGRTPTPIGDGPWGEELRSPGLYVRRGEDATPAPLCSVPKPSCAPSPPSEQGGTPLDTEQWLLLGLAILLWRCGCRTELMLALLYLAL